MIITHKNNLIQRCAERGYNLVDVMPCVIKQAGDIWTIDENHPSYPKTKENTTLSPFGGFVANNPTNVDKKNPTLDIGEGVGTELKKLLKFIGITASPTCGCNAKAKAMNENGIDWCKDNIDTIVGWLKEEADRRGLPFFTFGAKKLVKFAISRAEKANINANTV